MVTRPRNLSFLPGSAGVTGKKLLDSVMTGCQTFLVLEGLVTVSDNHACALELDRTSRVRKEVARSQT